MTIRTSHHTEMSRWTVSCRITKKSFEIESRQTFSRVAVGRIRQECLTSRHFLRTTDDPFRWSISLLNVTPSMKNTKQFSSTWIHRTGPELNRRWIRRIDQSRFVMNPDFRLSFALKKTDFDQRTIDLNDFRFVKPFAELLNSNQLMSSIRIDFVRWREEIRFEIVANRFHFDRSEMILQVLTQTKM